MASDPTTQPPEAFFAHLREVAHAIAPDYPWNDDDGAWKHLYAIEQSYAGLKLANADLHAIVNELRKDNDHDE